MPQIIIINLAALHELKNIRKEVLPRFVELCDKYSTGCFKGCSSGLFHASNYASVVCKYPLLSSLINKYKLGKINSQSFFDEIKQRLDLKEIESVESTPIAQANDLDTDLKAAWNSLIGNIDEDRIQQLFDKLKEGDKIYFISNTNEANVEDIFNKIKKFRPDLEFNVPPAKLSKNSENIRAHDLTGEGKYYACFSYQVGLNKTEGLIKHLISYDLQVFKDREILLVSAWQKDLDFAASIKIKCEKPEEFFANISHQYQQ